jgi:hypothetical protein
LTALSKTLQANTNSLQTFLYQPIRSNPTNTQRLIIRAKDPFFRRREGSRSNRSEFLGYDGRAEEIEVQVVFIVSEWILDLCSDGCETYYDKRGYL